MRLELPIAAKGSLNSREHWATRAERVRNQRRTVMLLWPKRWKAHDWRWPLEVQLTRRGPRPMDDDNVAGALKAVRDEVAKQLGVDDGDRARIRFLYEQELGAYGVVVELREAKP